MKKRFNQEELEVLNELVGEEIVETQQLYDEFKKDDVQKRLNLLKGIHFELNSNIVSKEIQLGIAVGQLSEKYQFKDIYNFITLKDTICMYFDTLKNLYEKFGFDQVNKLIIHIGNEKFADKEGNKDE